ncbi:MAG: nitroreductase family protein [Rikenellaceae bacterium]
MNALEMIKERRSVRDFKDEKVSVETMTQIIELCRWAPSWANFQVARYTLCDSEEVIARIAQQGVKNFAYNMKTLVNAKGVAVISYVKGKSGKVGVSEIDSTATQSWEVFDAGIATQTFCLAAHALGVGTCIFGVIDSQTIAQIVELPEDETVAALVVYGYQKGEHAPATPRKTVEEIMRFVK